MLIRDAEVEPGRRADVRVAGARIAAIAPGLDPRPGEPVLEARGGALLPGLHDHHVHVLALDAARRSVDCGPRAVGSPAHLARALAAAPVRAGWIRGVGYHESVAGPLGRVELDRWVPDRPVRVQHRSGSLWILNSAGLAALGLDAGPAPEGVERDADGRPTGRLYHLDAWLRARWPAAGPPDFATLARQWAERGVTGITDATPGNGPAEWGLFADALARGALPQRVMLMGGASLPRAGGPDAGGLPGPEPGAHKIRLADPALPAFDALAAEIDAAHRRGRPVAIHCVTRAEIVLATAALEAAGVRPGDRLEHASVAPPEVVETVARLGLCVVFQPNFVRERGDAYRRDVEPVDRPWLVRGRAWCEAGAPLGAGTDAPFGDPDPWAAMRAAVDRRTRLGERLGPGEALEPERALALFTTPPEAPGGRPRRVAPGAAADLCLLDRPWRLARDRLSAADVAASLRTGRLLFSRDTPVASAERTGPGSAPAATSAGRSAPDAA